MDGVFMEQKMKIWEKALLVGLLAGLLCAPAGAEGTALSRWPEGNGRICYQVSLFPFGFALAEETVLAQAEPEPENELPELRLHLLDWWQALRG